MHSHKVILVLLVMVTATTARVLLAEKDAPANACSANNAVSLAANGNGSAPITMCSDKRQPLRPNQPRFTAKQLADSRTVKEAMLEAALGAVPDYQDFVRNVINDFCWLNSGTGCNDIDLDGKSDWYRKYFSSYSSLATDSDATPITLNNDTYPYKSSYRKFACQYNPVSPQDCSLSGQTITTNSVQETHTQTYSYQGKVGFVVKVKGGGNEGTWEQTFDFGYSQSSGEATTKLSGETTVAGVKVPMDPNDPRCVVIEVILQRVKQTGKMAVWVRSQGWVGTHQNDRHHWKYVDSDPNETHYYRAFWFPWLVQQAQQYNLPSAKGWTVMSDGYAYMSTPFTLDFDVANTGYANPQMYPKDDPRCTQT